MPQQLAAELSELQRFRALLGQEQEVLKQGDVEQLPDLVQQKSALTARLGEMLARREQALAAAGFRGSREGMEDWLSGRPAQAPEHAQWRELLALAEEARNEHAVNGKLIAIHLQRNQQAITALMSARGQVMTYGPDGQHRIGGGGRALGSA